jgi:uncharacterized protein YceH (UPF0502 family)
MGVRPLSPLEARVLAVLVEKQATVPDTYPMSLNGITNGCNQKSSRDPVMDATEGEAQLAVDALKALDLVYETSGARVPKYAQNFGRVYGVPSQSVALLTLLMLRGPQTLAELRMHTERLHKFADVSAVEAFTQELRGKGFVIELPRAPGAREPRWMHQLSGDIDPTQFTPPIAEPHEKRSVDISLSELAALKARVDALEAENAALKATLNKVCSELGIAP